MHDKLDRHDVLFLAVCALLLVACGWFGISWFSSAFPEASIDFRYDRTTSEPVAAGLLDTLALGREGWKHAAEFEHDSNAKVFLERSVGLEASKRLLEGEVRIWYWTHRWFRPLQREEYQVRVAPTGQIVSFQRLLPEELELPSLDAAAARAAAEQFLPLAGVDPAALNPLSESRRELPKRTQWIFTWESPVTRPAGAPYRYEVTVDGSDVGAYRQWLEVPESWIRSYEDLRSKNNAAGAVDMIFLALTMLAALVVFIGRIRRGDLKIRLVIWVSAICFVLVTGVALNGWPSALAAYDTTTSYPAFVAQQIVFAVLQGLGMALLLGVIVGSGEALYRERFPRHLAMPRVFSREALGSKRVFKGFILGYALVAVFLAYQVAFYLISERLGAWAPADIPYDSILNTAFPWLAVLFIGFFPAFSEEFMSRAFSIPLFERIFRSKIFAIVLAGFIWGFGHTAYPNQPFYIRGLEVGIAGVVIGMLMFRYGLLPLLVWHYTVDAVYTSLLLFRSGNTYYVVSAAIASFVFILPPLVAIALYFRRGGFVPDESLENRAEGTVPAPPPPPEGAPAPLPPAKPLTPALVALAAAAVAVAAAAALLAPPRVDDVARYPITAGRAEAIARQHLGGARVDPLPERVVTVPASGFSGWNEQSPKADGGTTEGYFQTAARYIAREAGVAELIEIQRGKIEAALWRVRFFTPGVKEEIAVEIDPRTGRVTGFERYLDESAPGPSIAAGDAAALATQALVRYGFDPAAFVLRESLAQKQPARMDWLLHFEERDPLAAEAFRRASVRIGGDEVVQVSRSVKIPERIRREARETRLADIVVTVLVIAGWLGILSLVILGVLEAIRRGRFRWRRAARLALFALPIPIVTTALVWNQLLAGYPTAIGWETFVVMMLTSATFIVGFQAGVVFLSIAILETIYPALPRLVSSEARRRLGRSAVAAAIAAGAIFFTLRTVIASLPAWLPRFAAPGAVSPPDEVAIALPALAVVWNALLLALGGSAAIAAIALFVHTSARRPLAHAALFFSLVLVFLPGGERHFSLPLAIGLVSAGVAWLVPRFVLRDNLLGYPLAFFLYGTVVGALGLAAHGRPDLAVNAAVLGAVAFAAVLWMGGMGNAGAIAQDANGEPANHA
jgi:membrane protease YdiL (CAAX protease family)